MAAGSGASKHINTRHFQAGHPDIIVLRSGEFVLRVRYLLAGL